MAGVIILEADLRAESKKILNLFEGTELKEGRNSQVMSGQIILAAFLCLLCQCSKISGKLYSAPQYLWPLINALENFLVWG